jgi:hypothetical protein
MSGDTIFISLTISMIVGTGAMLTALVGMRRARIELDRSRRDFGELKPVLAEMQQVLEAVSLEVERLGEAQRFTAQLQIERAETLRALQRAGEPDEARRGR